MTRQAQTVDVATWKPHPDKGSPYVVVDRVKTIREVYKETLNALVANGHSQLLGELEYFNPSDFDRTDPTVPYPYRWIAVYAVQGGSEGHYVHVDFVHEFTHVCPNDAGYTNHWQLTNLMLGKTFMGIEHANQLVKALQTVLVEG